MKYNILLVIVSFLFLTYTQAQSKKATAILKEVSEKTQSYETIKIAFTYKMDNPDADIHEQESGKLKVKGDKYQLSIAGQTVINDGETMWTYIEDANEVQINEVEEDEDDFLSPTKLLTSYSENYKAKYIGEKPWKGTKKAVLIELKPNEDKTFKVVELLIDNTLKRILSISIYDKNDNIFSYTIDEFEPNVMFDPSDFIFDPEEYPGIEIIDMR